MLFISGLADEGACWVDQVAGLRDGYRVTTFDNRGVGRSQAPEGPYAIADFARDTIALMDALGLEQPHVVGSSMGGAIAQELALAHPDRVRSLVLNGTWCRGDRFLHEVFRNWMWAARHADSVRDFLVAVNLWCFAPRIWNDGTMDGWLDAAEQSPHPQTVEAFCWSAEALLGHDTGRPSRGITVPTLVTVGELDLRPPAPVLGGDRRADPRRVPARRPGCRAPAVPGVPGGVQPHSARFWDDDSFRTTAGKPNGCARRTSSKRDGVADNLAGRRRTSRQILPRPVASLSHATWPIDHLVAGRLPRAIRIGCIAPELASKRDGVADNLAGRRRRPANLPRPVASSPTRTWPDGAHCPSTDVRAALQETGGQVLHSNIRRIEREPRADEDFALMC